MAKNQKRQTKSEKRKTSLDKRLVAARSELFYSRGDPEDPRLGELVRRVERALPSAFRTPYDVLLLGIPDDRGIAANQGRVGAKEAPDAIRHALYRLTPGTEGALEGLRWGDLGNLRLAETIKETHEGGVEVIRKALSHAQRVITLGGGHDLAYCDLRALIESAPADQRIGIINIDAHLDVRTDTQDINSGTAFYRLLKTTNDKRKTINDKRKTINDKPQTFFIEFAIQRQVTARRHLEFVQSKGGQVLFWDQIADDPVGHFARVLEEMVERCEVIGLSLDMDAVRMSDSPGVSAPSPVGLSAEQVVSILRLAGACSKVRTLGVFEVSPPLDIAECTVRLAALCVYEFALGQSDRLRYP